MGVRVARRADAMARSPLEDTQRIRSFLASLLRTFEVGAFSLLRTKAISLTQFGERSERFDCLSFNGDDEATHWSNIAVS